MNFILVECKIRTEDFLIFELNLYQNFWYANNVRKRDGDIFLELLLLHHLPYISTN